MRPLTSSPESRLGDVFWDLPPSIYYSPGYDIGCIIYIANHTDEPKEYLLMAYLYRGGLLLEEDPIQVYGYAWFTVDPGVYLRLHGTMVFDMTDVDLVVNLIEKETQEIIDSVSTRLIMPTTTALPPAWPTPEVPTTAAIDWSSIITVFMVVMMMNMMTGAFKGKEGS